MTPNQPLPHKITLSQGEKLTVTGVSEVREFLPDSALLSTVLGDLAVQGTDLELKTLTPEEGQVVITGHITGLCYLRQQTKAGFWARLTR